ncbi:HD-GYP domain-containing protein [Parasporobacterium paucivorans]|uniref:HDIG domain-containing protein n=1 Tax=Parasporobacterium paucivorans DSM 15970 TaxID=1122934 RepID=A0A1M6C5L4_9FIRM|nr:HD domain-containing phosphohydrolase [Parasporobacterium paucivorans]SHI56091.1 HDIG domain-containing protein [Parasporobacterium paucivorans DSM 15970]
MNGISEHEYQRTELGRNMKVLIQHGIAVSQYSHKLAMELGMEEKQCYDVAVASLLHDVGKLRLSGYSCADEGLTFENSKYTRMHSKFGYELLKEKDYSEEILQMVLHHHENFDGTGYPDNLKGEEIPVGARIIRICDSFTALHSGRSYREAFGQEEALHIMIDEVKNFDLQFFLAFQRMINVQDAEEFLIEKRIK